jgi:hypothetical protein
MRKRSRALRIHKPEYRRWGIPPCPENKLKKMKGKDTFRNRFFKTGKQLIAAASAITARQKDFLRPPS